MNEIEKWIFEQVTYLDMKIDKQKDIYKKLDRQIDIYKIRQIDREKFSQIEIYSQTNE